MQGAIISISFVYCGQICLPFVALNELMLCFHLCRYPLLWIDDDLPSLGLSATWSGGWLLWVDGQPYGMLCAFVYSACPFVCSPSTWEFFCTFLCSFAPTQCRVVLNVSLLFLICHFEWNLVPLQLPLWEDPYGVPPLESYYVRHTVVESPYEFVDFWKC